MKNVKKITLISTSICFSIVMFNMAIIALAFPEITKSISSKEFSDQWIINSFILALVASSLIIGKISDIVTAKSLIIVGLIFFMLSSLGCFFSTTFLELIINRAIQGFSAACLIIPCTKIINDIFTYKKFGKAISISTGYGSIALLASPLFGGLIIQHTGWRTIFLVNIVLCVIALIITFKIDIPFRVKKILNKIEILSTALVSIGLSIIVFGIMEIHYLNKNSYFPYIIFLALFCIVLSLLLKRSYSVKHLKKSFVICNIVTVFNETFSIFIIFLILYMQNTLNFTPSETGFLILSFYVLILVSNFSSGHFILRHGVRPPLIISSALIVTGLAISSFILSVKNYVSILTIIIRVDLGLDAVFNSIKTIIAKESSEELLGSSFGIQGNSSFISATLSFAIMSSIISHYSLHHISDNIGFYFGFKCILTICVVLAILNLLLCIILTNKKTAIS